MASNRFQRAGRIGGRSAASELQKTTARKTICATRPWESRIFAASIVLSRLPDTDAIQALYLQHGFKALVSIAICNEGYLVSALIHQRRDFDADSIAKIVQILEGFQNG